MEIKLSFKERLRILQTRISQVFFKRTELSQKSELNTKSFKLTAISFFLIFVTVVFLMPTEQAIEFSEKIEQKTPEETSYDNSPSRSYIANEGASNLWGSPQTDSREKGQDFQLNYNTTTILGSRLGNSRTQLRAGIRMPLRLVDKFIVSQDPVPILAELILNSTTDSGLHLPAGTRFYGEAAFQKGSDRASVQLKQISLPSGQIKKISGIGIGKDGQPGIPGRVYSDGMKNTAGQVLTSFVGGLAAGSVETDVFGRSTGGLQNGFLSAVAATAKDRAQAYGEKLKAEREWIEVEAGSECDALLSESLNLQMGTEE